MTTWAPALPTRDPTRDERQYYSLTKRVYALVAPVYDLVTSPLGRLRRRVAALARVQAHERVLDVATGTGAQARAFADRGAMLVVGVDLSGPMLRVATKKTRASNVRFEQADATALPFADASFDVSCVSFALHEMPASVRERTVAEMARVTGTGGRIIVVDFARPTNALTSAYYHLARLYEPEAYAEFVASDLHELLEHAGIEIHEEHPALRGIVRIVIGAPRRTLDVP